MIKAYRVITDEPQGLCIGFKSDINPELLEEFDCIDNGGSNVFIHEMGHIVVDTQGVPSAYPEDLLVWRDKREFDAWAQEILD